MGMVSYQPLIELTARRELHTLPVEERRELRAVLKDVAATEQPSHHAKAKQLQGQPGMFRVRTGNCRAVCTLRKPALLILKCGKRKEVYDDLDEIHTRAEGAAVEA